MDTLKKIATSRLFRLFVSLCLLGYMAHKFGFAAIADSMKTSEPRWLFAAVAMFIVSGIVGALQWGILLRFHDIRPGVYGTMSRYFMGLFFNYVLPGFVGGDVVRIYQATTVSGRMTQAVSSTLADRVIGLLVLVMFSLGAFALMPGGPAESVLPVAVAMFLVIAGFAAAFALKPVGRFIDRAFGRFVPTSIRDKLAAVYRELHDLTRSPVTLTLVFCTSVVIQLTRIGVHYLCGHAVGIDAGFVYFALFVPIMEIVASIPISLGGIGVRETVGVTLFATIGIARPDVVAYSILATLAGFVGSLPGAAAFALKK